MEKTVVCKSCGAAFDEEEIRCPYCGSTNIKGAEKEYMEKLKDVREDLEGLDLVPAEELQRIVKKQGRRVGRVVIFVIITAILLLGLFYITGKSGERDYRKSYSWKSEHFPQMDELYEAGRYDELVDLVYYDFAHDKDSFVYEWEHYQFLDDYEMLRSLCRELENSSKVKFMDYDLQWIFYGEWRAKGVIYHRDQYTEQEYKALLPMLEKAEADFDYRWNMSQEDYETLYSYLTDPNQGYVPYDVTDKYMKKWLKENR